MRREWQVYATREILTGGRGYLKPYLRATGPMLDGFFLGPGYGNFVEETPKVKVVELQPHERIFNREQAAEVLWRVIHNDNAYNDQLRVNHALNELFASTESRDEK